MRLAVATVSIFIMFGTAYSEELSDSQCAEVLRYGIHDTHGLTDAWQLQTRVQSNACSSSSSSEGGKFVYGDSNGAYSQGESDNNCATSLDEENFSRNRAEWSKTINQFVIQAWSNCLNRSGSGLRHWLETTSTAEEFVYHLINIGGVQNGVEVSVSNARCDIPKGPFSVDGAQQSYLCERDAEDAVTIRLAAPNGLPAEADTVLELSAAPIWFGKETQNYHTNELMPTGAEGCGSAPKSECERHTSGVRQALAGCEFLFEQAKLIGDTDRVKAGLEGIARQSFTWWVEGARPSAGPDAGKGVRVIVPSYAVVDGSICGNAAE